MPPYAPPPTTPPSPPPPSPPLLPPGSTSVATLTVVANLDLTTEEFDATAQASYTANLAAVAGVNVTDVTLSIAAASIVVTATITTPTIAASQSAAASVGSEVSASTLSGVFLGMAV
eukprot:5023269-Prymnesium_polylepis.1